MAEKLGICTRYLARETTFAGLQLADLSKRHGTPTAVIARDDCNTGISGWDRHVVDERQGGTLAWLKTCDTIIWTAVPDIMELVHARDLGITTALLVSWETLHPFHEGTVREINKLILPYKCVSRAVQAHWYMPNVKMITMPWVLPAPPCLHDPMRKGLTVHFPLYDSQPQRADQSIFRLMERVLQEFKEARVSVACGHRWSRSSRRLLKRLKRDYNNRLVTYGPPDLYERLQLFGAADLTVWAPRFESFGLVGLSSLAMGTPVISWDIQPQNEYLHAWKNAVLVPCATSDNWLGVPEVVGGYPQFEELLLATLRDRALLAKLKSAASNGLDARRKAYDASWQEFSKKD
jgi:glycosyltransferase involved in cell wall biosynthesis